MDGMGQNGYALYPANLAIALLRAWPSKIFKRL